MYTQCPECETTFKLGAEDLRLANGKVRCGDCNHVFNALEFLAEEVEEELVTEGAATDARDGWTSSESNPSGELEPDLDEYESSAYLDDEPEYEPAPDDEDDEDDDGPILYIGGDESEPEQAEADEAEAEDEPEDEFEETDVEFDDDVWEQVAGVVTDPASDDELDDPAEDAPVATEFEADTEVEAETWSDNDDEALPEDSGEDLPDVQAADEPLEEEPSVEEFSEDEPVDVTAAGEDDEAAAEGDDLEFNVPEEKWGNFFGPLPKGQTASVWQPPQLDESDAEPSAEEAWDELTGDEDETETGDDILVAADADAPSWKETEAPSSNSGLYLLGGIVLAVLLVTQLVHYNRDRLAASESWGANVRAVYGAIGSTLYPDWSVDDYEIRGSEVVAGETGRDILDIRAQIANTGTRATGLPRLRVMLKDRWSNPVAAQDFSAAEYATNVPADGLLQPGDMVSAHVSIQDPGSGAQGFELELCLPRRDTGLECTGQPFK